MARRNAVIVAITAACLVGAGVSAGYADSPMPGAAAVPPLRASFPRGYLAPQSVPDSIALIPPPPVPGSAAMKRDRDASRAALGLRGSPRWTRAAADADLFAPGATDAFSCAAGLAIGAGATPRVDALLHRALSDLAVATRAAKARYQRPRPFMVNRQPTCTPDAEPVLRKDGSYPSGHSAIGYGWGLILGELIPDRATQLVARGRAFGDSRRVCNVHWLSDVEEGRVVAGAVVARLHAEPAFRADLDAARAELAAGRFPPPAGDCAAEALVIGAP